MTTSTPGRSPGPESATGTPPTQPTASAALGHVTGTPRRWLQLEGAAALGFGALVYLRGGGEALWLLPLLLLVDVSMAGYLAGPRAGAFAYNLAHNWATGLAVLGAGAALGVPALVLGGAVLVAHVGMDRLAGYGLKYPTAFRDTHLGRLGGRDA